MKSPLTDYMDSLKNPKDYMSGDYNLLTGILAKDYSHWESLEEEFFSNRAMLCKEEREELAYRVKGARDYFKYSLTSACEKYATQQQSQYKSIMESKEEKPKRRASRSKKESAPETSEKNSVDKKKTEEKKQTEKRAPQMVTVNGDKVSHAHVYKSNTSDDWFFTAKINDVPLKPQKVTKEDMEGVINKTKPVEEMMQTYYPTKLMPKVSPEEFKMPTTVMTPDGMQTVHKFNVYKVTEQNNIDYGKYRFYAQVGDKKMSESASKKDLDAYFDRVVKPADLITKVFGERLHMQEYYKMFQLPENSNIEAKNIRLMKNPDTNRFEISVKINDVGRTSSKEISYDDRQSYFSHKTATKEQLAAKYLNNEIKDMLNQAPKVQKAKQLSLSV